MKWQLTKLQFNLQVYEIIDRTIIKLQAYEICNQSWKRTETIAMMKYLFYVIKQDLDPNTETHCYDSL